MLVPPNSLIACGLSVGLILWPGASLVHSAWFWTDSSRERALCRYLVCDTNLLLQASYASLWQLTDPPRRGQPYRWCELGEALLEAGQIGPVPVLPFPGLRAGTELAHNPDACRQLFHLRLGEARPALEQMSAILRQVPDYDGVLLHNFLLLTVPPGEILRYGLPEDRRAGQSYLRFLLSQNRPADAGAVWEWLRARNFTDDPLAAQYAGFLLDQHRPEDAANVFAAHLGDRAAGYRRSNFVFNPDFRSPPTGCRLDWRLGPSSAARLTLDSDGLRIDFAGTDNLDFHQVGQTVVLPPGRYRLRTRVRSAGVTTDQGVYVQLSPPGARTEAVLGDTPWKTLETSFVVSQRPLVAEAQVVRRPSWKFDNKIAGTVWVSGVEVARVD